MQEKDILNFIQTMLNVASDFAITKIEKAEEKVCHSLHKKCFSLLNTLKYFVNRIHYLL